MGRRGPKPTPTAILRRRGSGLVVNRDDRGEPTLEWKVPDAPDSLDHDAIEYWDRIIAIMCKVPGWLTEADSEILGMFCQSLADRDRFRVQWMAEGAVYEATSDRGGVSRKTNPAYTNYLAAFDRAVKLAGALGLSPADRASVGAGGSASRSDQSRSELIKPAQNPMDAKEPDGEGQTPEE